MRERSRQDKDLLTSAMGRLFKLGGVATRVGMSLAAEQAVGFLFSDPIAQARKTEKFLLNAMRVTEALGELKGAAMKAGQMLSVHEGLLPPEVSQVLRSLQNEAPRVSFATMQAVLRRELPEYQTLFESLEEEAIAAASIGQVYRGRLRDGRLVAVKVQYPGIDEVVRSDLKNLKKLFGALVAMMAEVDFDEIWEELKARLLEELDYIHEADNMERMSALHAGIPQVIVPSVVREASTTRVLTMEYVAGITPDQACSDAYDQSRRDAWGAALLEFVIRGLLEHRFLHADPNFANYAFTESGGLIVYDHGCAKEVPEALAVSYARVLRALIDDDLAALPDLLFEMGIYRRKTGRPVLRKVLDPIAVQARDMVGPEPFRFSSETEIYDIVLGMKRQYLDELTDVSLPPDMVFVNRTLSGLFGNLCRLQSEGRWRDLLAPYARSVESSPDREQGEVPVP
jgi:predicted unusual protein kinase regulating ubiquinone biosynthesis (AarF/ABC1/UbiB family)